MPIVKEYMSNYFHIGKRLKEERERMSFNQADYAAIAGATRKTQYNYEIGKCVPDGAYLIAILHKGADIQYILTGIRNVKESSLTPKQCKLLNDYENADKMGKKIIEATALEAAKSRI